MQGLRPVLETFEEATSFFNKNVVSILPFSVIFFIAAIMYSISWYSLDFLKDTACFNGNYLIELLFCNLYLGVIGKHLIATTISSFAIVPFAGLVYLIDNIHRNKSKGVVDSIYESSKGITKIIIFRAGLVTLLFMPFIFFVLFNGQLINDGITATGRLTISKLVTREFVPISITLLFGFVLLALLEPIFQYVEFEVLLNGSRVRDAIRNSYKLAMKYKQETFISGFGFVFVWYMLLFSKLLYLVNQALCISLIAAVLIESFVVFPLRTVTLYMIWKNIQTGYERETDKESRKELNNYMDKMLLG